MRLAAFKLMQEFFANLRCQIKEGSVLADDLLRRFLRFLELGVFAHHDGYGITLGCACNRF